MVLSLLPVSLVGADTETTTPAYAVIFQKAHNQTEGSLAIDIYLQATVASEVTGYQLEVTPADGLTLTGVVDNTGNDNVKASGTTVVYDPAGLKPITLGTAKVLVATATVTGETLPANVGEAITVTNALVTTAEAQYTPELSALNYGCTDHTCGHGTGEWKALTQADLEALCGKDSKGNTLYFLGSGNYYLTEDIVAAYKTYVSEENAKINLCLNGYTFTSPAADKLLEVGANGAEVNFCDCTATGTGEGLVAGKFILRYYNWGNFRMAGVNSKLNCTNVIIEGAEDAVSYDAKNSNIGNAATFYQPAAAVGSSIYVENVLIKDVNASKTVIDTRAEGYYKNVTFVNCSGGENDADDQLAIFATNGSHASSGTRALTIDGCKFIDCEGDVLDTNQKPAINFTLKGDVQAEGAFFITKSCKVNLELGDNADVTIRTENDKTEETLADQVVIPEGATLPAGTLLYKNVDMLVDYVDGKFSWVGHAHKAQTFANGTEEGHTVEGMSFKAWDDSTSLPTDGNWYLITDVALSARASITNGKVLNLDLNGHTIKQTKTTTAILEVQGGGTFNLFDCQGGYDEAGKWTGGKLTGGTGGSGGAVLLQPGVAGDTTKRAVFNMYGGSLSGNHTASSGGGVYVGYSRVENGKNRAGAMFNMYDGEIANNTSNAWGGAVTMMGYSHTATSGTVGLDPELGLGAQFNLHGGKIYGNVTEKIGETTGFAEGTIHVTYDAVMNMTGGEIYNNSAERGGAIFMSQKANKVTITGGKIYGNSAVESEYKRTQYKLTTNTSGAATGYTIYQGMGGAIYCHGGTLVIKNIELSDNISTRGGAIFADNGGNTNVQVENCVFDGNTSKDFRTAKFDESVKNTSGGAYTSHNQNWGNGGVVCLDTSTTTVSFKNCQFTNNQSLDPAGTSAYSGAGGAIYADYIKYLTIDGCTFDGNIAEKDCGGAVNLRNDNTAADIRNCVFTNNTAGNAGGAIYTVNGSILKLTDTLIYGNNNTGNAMGGGIYVTSQGGRVILSGKVVIDQNTYKGTHGIKTDLAFQNQTARTYLAEVDELGAGSSVNMYFDCNATSTVITEDKAEGYVKLAPDATQSDWDCGWITVTSKANTTARQVAYIDLTDDSVDNKTFEWGHYHKDAEGNYYALHAWTSTNSLPDKPADDGIGYYLTKDVTISTANNRTEYRPGAHSENQYDFELCFNGHDVTVPSNVATAAIVLRSVNAWIGDCTASFDNNGHLIGGGAVKGAHKSENGGGMYFTDDDSIGTNITLYGIEFNGCYETVKRNGTASPGYAGGALHARNKSNTVDQTDITVIGCKFVGNYTNQEGGAICSLNGADFVIKDTVFEDNYTGRYGGAIAMIGASGAKGELDLDNCRFIGNYTTSNATKWTDDAATEDVDETITPMKGTGLGGAVYASNTKVDVKDCYFEGNRAYNAENLTNISWTSDVGIGQGGAIYLTSSATVDVEGSTFVDNYAAYQAGAIYYYGGTNHITSSVFEGNIGEQYGGALFTLNSGAVLHITGTADAPSVFRNNQSLGFTYTKADGTKATANGRGGAIECMNGTTSMTYCQFYDNTARYEGGAVRLGGGGGTTKVYSLDNCYFEGNESTASSGGALYIHAVTKEATVTDCDFVDNTADTQGGGLYLRGSTVKSGDTVISVPNITVNGGTFEGNKAGDYSGALHVAQATTLTANGVTFKNNETKNGGAITTGESAAIVNCNNCLFTGNTATNNGGAVNHLWFGPVAYTGCTFEGNTAANNGGALYIQGNSKAVATIGGAGDEACTFTGNTAKSAGAVWAGSATSGGALTTPTTNIINSTFTENTATNDVAAVKSCNKHQLSLTDCTITDNTSKIYGALHVTTANAGLTLAGKMVVTDNISTDYADHAENTDLFYQDYAETDAGEATVDMTGLTEGSTIGVYVMESRMAEDPVLTKNSSAAAFGYLYANTDRLILTTKDNEVLAVKYIDASGNVYGDVQSAIQAAEAAGAETFQLQAATTEELTLTTLTYIDLNGKDAAKITVPEGKVLTLVDTTTDDYDCSDGFGSVTVEGAYKAYAQDSTSGSLKRYVVIADEDGKLSAHRVYLAITAKTLRPTNAGVGFKAIFAGDEIVAENIVYGVQLSGYSDYSQVLAASFDTMEPGALTNTPNQKTVVIYDAITAENTSRWDADLYGRPFITIGETTVYGKNVTVNMKTMAANALVNGDATVVAAVNEMLTKCGVSVN